MKKTFPILVPALCASLTACGGGSDIGNGRATLKGGRFTAIPLSFIDDTGQTVSTTISYSVDQSTS
ncbi:MAG: hypothetical protein LBV61_02160 [Burkholderiaceae bacterium]|jgi:predicted small secreted protein|nr:hypothetical protein [Burkholderiaceae bacterium]